MSPKKFKELSIRFFGEFLKEYQFDMYEKLNPVFIKKKKNYVYDFIIPQLGSRGVWFDIIVFSHSPQLNNSFYERLENGIDIPSAYNSFLHPITGVGQDQKLYRCRTEEGFIRNFHLEAVPALEQFGLPFLDENKTIEDVYSKIPEHMREHYNSLK